MRKYEAGQVWKWDTAEYLYLILEVNPTNECGNYEPVRLKLLTLHGEECEPVSQIYQPRKDCPWHQVEYTDELKLKAVKFLTLT